MAGETEKASPACTSHNKGCHCTIAIANNNWSQTRTLPAKRMRRRKTTSPPSCTIVPWFALRQLNCAEVMPKQIASVWGGSDLSSHNRCNVWVYCVMFPASLSYLAHIPKCMFGFQFNDSYNIDSSFLVQFSNVSLLRQLFRMSQYIPQVK